MARMVSLLTSQKANRQEKERSSLTQFSHICHLYWLLGLRKMNSTDDSLEIIRSNDEDEVGQCFLTSNVHAKRIHKGIQSR